MGLPSPVPKGEGPGAPSLWFRLWFGLWFGSWFGLRFGSWFSLVNGTGAARQLWRYGQGLLTIESATPRASAWRATISELLFSLGFEVLEQPQFICAVVQQKNLAAVRTK